jgi:hypothetical protein
LFSWRHSIKRNSDVLALATVPPGATTSAAAVHAAKNWNARWLAGDRIEKLSFTSATIGWARTASGEALATKDAGLAWQIITPAGAHRRSAAKPSKIR